MPAEPRSHVSVEPAARAPSAASCQPGRSFSAVIAHDGAIAPISRAAARGRGGNTGAGPGSAAGRRAAGMPTRTATTIVYLRLRGLQS